MRGFLVIASLFSVSSLSIKGQVVLEPTVVEGSRLQDEEEQEEPILLSGNTTRIGEELIEESVSNFVPDLLEFEAGVSSRSLFGSSNSAAPSLRGFGENSQLRTLVLVDGLSVSRDDLAVAPFSQTPLVDLEEISVLRGGRTVRYGTGASAGVISLKTKRSRNDKPSGKYQLTIGSDETFRQRAVLSLPFEGWEVKLTREDFFTEGFRDQSEEEFTTFGLTVLTPEAEWGENRFSLSVSDTQFQSPGGISLEALREDSRQAAANIDEEFISESVRFSNLLEWHLLPNLDLKAQVAYLKRDRFGEFGNFIGIPGFELPDTRTAFETESWDGELVLSWKKERLRVEGGLRGRISQADFERLVPGAGPQTAELDRFVGGGFLSAEFEPIDSLVLSAGVSGDWSRVEIETGGEIPASQLFQGENTEGGSAFEVGLEYQISEEFKVWSRYHRTLRFPVLDEIGSFQGFPLDPPFNEDLVGERGEAIEVGFLWEEKDWEIGSTVFRNRLEDEIFFVNVGGVGGSTGFNTNLPETLRWGWESHFKWESEHWRFSLFYTQLLARFSEGIGEGDLIPLVPRSLVSGSLVWQPTNEWTIGLEGSYQSELLDGNDRADSPASTTGLQTVPSRTVWNLRGSYQITDDLEVFCRINNLFDRRFATVAFSGNFFPAPGRQVFIGGNYTF